MARADAAAKLTRVRPGRESLMRTAVGLMGEHGYEGTSIRDIANAAGVSVAALYYHFPSKLDLLREFLEEAHDVVLARLRRQLDEAGDDPRTRLDTAVAALISSSLHSKWARRATQVAWREVGRLPERDRRAIGAKREEMVELIESVLVAGTEAGAFSTPEPLEAARAIVTLCISVVDPFAEPVRSMAEVIELHQRFAATLAGPPTKPAKRRR